MTWIGAGLRAAPVAAVIPTLAIFASLARVDAQQVEGVCFCDGSGSIPIAQLVHAVSIALGSTDCPAPPPIELQDCEGVPNGTTCDAGMDGVVRTCEAGMRASCAPTDPVVPVFVDNGDGTVTDRRTCLVWEMKTGPLCPGPDNCSDPHDVGNEYTWSSLVGGSVDLNGTVKTEFLETLNDSSGDGCFAGHCDWRLPSSDGFVPPSGEPAELESILDLERDGLKIDPIFGPTNTADYWTSTSELSSGGGFAWVVNFQSGAQAPIQKVLGGPARAVRGAPVRVSDSDF